jgi:hypothetical protein
VLAWGQASDNAISKPAGSGWYMNHPGGVRMAAWYAAPGDNQMTAR